LRKGLALFPFNWSDVHSIITLKLELLRKTIELLVASIQAVHRVLLLHFDMKKVQVLVIVLCCRLEEPDYAIPQVLQSWSSGHELLPIVICEEVSP